ncbi:serine/threonine-protein kinase [Prosthecobacter sp.]|uniref:serine/threonine-protein kinase n=1 Tax=Prosthecobacter sp. TaxID=1965333 RepID=UPI0037835CF2
MTPDPFSQLSQENVQRAQDALRAGQAVFGGRFVLQRHLGQGGMGQVWLAQDTVLEQPRALKFVLPTLLTDATARKRLRNEARLGTELAHSRIVRVFDFVEEPDGARHAAVVMEYVDGRTLSDLLAEKDAGFFEPHEIEKWIRDVISGLRHAHEERQRYHLDLKPGNIIIETATGHAKLLDFGISRSAKDALTRVTGQVSSGTLPYMSPQQLEGEPPSAADDVYGLGATVYELLTGTPPFFRGKLEIQICGKEPEPLMARRRQNAREGLNASIGQEIPAPWQQWAAAALSKTAADRILTEPDAQAAAQSGSAPSASPQPEKTPQPQSIPLPETRPASEQNAAGSSSAPPLSHLPPQPGAALQSDTPGSQSSLPPSSDSSAPAAPSLTLARSSSVNPWLIAWWLIPIICLALGAVLLTSTVPDDVAFAVGMIIFGAMTAALLVAVRRRRLSYAHLTAITIVAQLIGEGGMLYLNEKYHLWIILPSNAAACLMYLVLGSNAHRRELPPNQGRNMHCAGLLIAVFSMVCLMVADIGRIWEHRWVFGHPAGNWLNLSSLFASLLLSSSFAVLYCRRHSQLGRVPYPLFLGFGMLLTSIFCTSVGVSVVRGSFLDISNIPSAASLVMMWFILRSTFSVSPWAVLLPCLAGPFDFAAERMDFPTALTALLFAPLLWQWLRGLMAGRQSAT